MSTLKSSQHWFETTSAEDYWNSSSTTAFDFEDDRVQLVFNSPKTVQTTSKEFNSFIEANVFDTNDLKVFDERDADKQLVKCLSLNIEAESTQSIKQVKTPEAAIYSLKKGIDCSLHQFKSKKEKLKLLDLAIDTNDGNTIIIVINFLRQTLSKRIFNTEISRRPVASNHLINYFQNCDQLNEAIEFFTYLGKSDEVAFLSYSQCLKTSDVSAKVRLLKHCKNNYFRGIDKEFEFWESCVNSYINLLELQQPIDAEDSRQEKIENNPKFTEIPRHSILDLPVITTLYYCCLYHYELSENNFASPKAICKSFSITEKQFVWTALRSLALAAKWAEIDALFEYKSWLGGKKIKSPISFQKVVKLLNNHGAPQDLIVKYLKLVDNTEEKLNLATIFKLHNFVIEMHVSNRDRRALLSYVEKLQPHSEEYINAQDYLKNPSIKWKN
ncbi:spermatogenesis-defective protein 39-like protein [Dinothrombium tinctorium]|uniref:Spermatogenesis-defective protein 39-like protein n=1 Tax=Dinothrombium tinctorium TaxID=1965070 RepID=A0A443R790_9ACAR|nr:spermatogenesis-defective protein 39-like protein [Dinothrombium tinctorium]